MPAHQTARAEDADHDAARGHRHAQTSGAKRALTGRRCGFQLHAGLAHHRRNCPASAGREVVRPADLLQATYAIHRHGLLMQLPRELKAHRSYRAIREKEPPGLKKLKFFLDSHIASQLLLPGFEWADTLLLGGQRLPMPGCPTCSASTWRQPAPGSRLAQLHVPPNLANSQTVHPDHPHDLQREARVKHSLFRFRHLTAQVIPPCPCVRNC